MQNQKGFTLVELLVAATIIGSLVVFATISYRKAAAETRWTAAKAKLEQVAGAVQRWQADYPAYTLAEGIIANSSADCQAKIGQYVYTGRLNPSNLIACGFLEKGDWNAQSSYYYYAVCRNGDDSVTFCQTDSLACVAPRESANLPADYKSKVYCIDTFGVGHEHE